MTDLQKLRLARTKLNPNSASDSEARDLIDQVIKSIEERDAALRPRDWVDPKVAQAKQIRGEE